MNWSDFSQQGRKVLDFVTNYYETLRSKRPQTTVKTGFLQPQLPAHAPEDPENFDDVFRDFQEIIMPGVTNWQHPHFFAYFPTASSPPAILADILASMTSMIGFTWASGPSCTELEVVIMDWLAKAIGLPDQFYHASRKGGGGVIQHTASCSTHFSVVIAKSKYFKYHDDCKTEKELVCYFSDQAHSSVERATTIANVRFHVVTSDEKYAMRGEALRKAIAEDKAKGLRPFYVAATLGTTGLLAFDNLKEITQVAKEENLWVHVDAAYAGCALVCPEYRYIIDGVEDCDSFNFNPHKWLLMNFDLSAMWFRNVNDAVESFKVDPVYLDYQKEGRMPDFRHWHVPLGRRCRALKAWFTLRIYGLKGLREYIRNHILLARYFESLVRVDNRFVIIGEVTMGLVCFRLKESNQANRRLQRALDEDGRIFLVGSVTKSDKNVSEIGAKDEENSEEKVEDEIYFLRLVVCSKDTQKEDIDFAWNVIIEELEKLNQ